ncbi:hypothetical protein FGE12_29145 [Aggregicoccus sp. 17bor-14]|uniref:hypothetical protein n=1 Tax=Myxococcaceae TaxID=31 RepID=UPI00129C712F|nr:MULTISPECIES: hypothetical protein [Myxococcaceae]MBF5046517.1 hypothetical protein [Simulacricoccus sp. 17bor-14]MRI92232.1 hypothetical protein [Aggregicoccus sp. 17bor-14]
MSVQEQRLEHTPMGRGLASWKQGLAAGLCGTLGISAVEAVRDRLLGHRAPYAASRIAERLAWRLARVRLSPRAARWSGTALRYGYGPLLGVLQARASRHTARWPLPARGLAAGAALSAMERLTLPLTGATPPARRWSRAERLALPLQALAFGLVTAAALQRARA